MRAWWELNSDLQPRENVYAGFKDFIYPQCCERAKQLGGTGSVSLGVGGSGLLNEYVNTFRLA